MAESSPKLITEKPENTEKNLWIPPLEKNFCFLKGFALGKQLTNTLKALPLARIVHEGQYRNGLANVEGEMIKLPYVVHVLKVCSTLVALDLPLTHDELDILYSAALLHDALEDAPDFFPKSGRELETDYNMPPEILETIRLLSKHTGANEYEINRYFDHLKKNKFALLIKMADRSHNVEDLYNIKNVQKYIKETKDYFLAGKDSIATYGKQNYPELSNGITILKSKILSLTEATETMIYKYEHIIDEKDKEIQRLEAELNAKRSGQQST